MEDGMDTNAANSPDHTADMTTQEVDIKKNDFSGSADAQVALDRSLNQAADCCDDMRSTSQAAVSFAKDMATQARFTNLSNRGA